MHENIQTSPLAEVHAQVRPQDKHHYVQKHSKTRAARQHSTKTPLELLAEDGGGKQHKTMAILKKQSRLMMLRMLQSLPFPPQPPQNQRHLAQRRRQVPSLGPPAQTALERSQRGVLP
jgi:hypothetical protein